VVSPAVGIRDNLAFVVDSVSQLAAMAAAGDPDVARVAADLVPALQDAHGSAEDLVRRIERFRQGEEPRVADAAGTSLERAVHAAAGIVRSRVRERARLVLDTTEKPSVKADPTQLSQIIVNLLLNAYEAIPPGNPTGNQIVVSTFARADRCGVVVEDTGGGVPPELAARLFEPFASSKEGGSRGLGLAIVRDIVESLAGTIAVENAARGAAFRVDLPRLG
jgi:two-component system, NtrC family, sensor kinase